MDIKSTQLDDSELSGLSGLKETMVRMTAFTIFVEELLT